MQYRPELCGRLEADGLIELDAADVMAQQAAFRAKSLGKASYDVRVMPVKESDADNARGDMNRSRSLSQSPVSGFRSHFAPSPSSSSSSSPTPAPRAHSPPQRPETSRLTRFSCFDLVYETTSAAVVGTVGTSVAAGSFGLVFLTSPSPTHTHNTAMEDEETRSGRERVHVLSDGSPMRHLQSPPSGRDRDRDTHLKGPLGKRKAGKENKGLSRSSSQIDVTEPAMHSPPRIIIYESISLISPHDRDSVSDGSASPSPTGAGAGTGSSSTGTGIRGPSPSPSLHTDTSDRCLLQDLEAEKDGVGVDEDKVGVKRPGPRESVENNDRDDLSCGSGFNGKFDTSSGMEIGDANVSTATAVQNTQNKSTALSVGTGTTQSQSQSQLLAFNRPRPLNRPVRVGGGARKPIRLNKGSLRNAQLVGQCDHKYVMSTLVLLFIRV